MQNEYVELFDRGMARIADEILPIMLSTMEPDQTFIDAFCGGCAIVERVPKEYPRIANDNNRYLIAMLQRLTTDNQRKPHSHLFCGTLQPLPTEVIIICLESCKGTTSAGAFSAIHPHLQFLRFHVYNPPNRLYLFGAACVKAIVKVRTG